MKFKVNDRVQVTSCYYGHEFEIGEVVTVVHVREDTKDYILSNGEDYWYLRENEIEEV